MNIDKSKLLRELQKENKWWQSHEVPANLLRQFKRSDYFVYKDFLKNDKINVIIGPRRVGKTILLQQLIQSLIDEGVNPKRILFLSLERPVFQLLDNPIQDCVAVFEEMVLKESIETLEDSIYLFIDEASREATWANTLKEYFDRQYKIKYIITGSSSPALYQSSSESLVGRKNDVLILPMKFRDVVRFQNPDLDDELKKMCTVLRLSLTQAVEQQKIDVFWSVLQDIYTNFGPRKETELQIALNEYLLRGGYPEFYDVQSNWLETSRSMREAYFNSIVTYDIMRVFGVRNPDKLKKLYYLLAMSTASVVNLNNIRRDIGSISRNAIDDYFEYLQKTHLINTALQYKRNRRLISNEQKKVYVHDVGMRNAVLGMTEEDVSDSRVRGFLAETITNDHLHRLKYNLEPAAENEIFFWKDESNKEVDFIIELNRKIIPLEVKYQEQIHTGDYSTLNKAYERFKSPFGILLSKNTLQKNEKNITIPLWIFLLIC